MALIFSIVFALPPFKWFTSEKKKPKHGIWGYVDDSLLTTGAKIKKTSADIANVLLLEFEKMSI